ncbi:Transposon Ty3-I Gag-Pol polyprotein [Dictyocoela muelleri]|nr:Transposon Ty3-I Gag-Pol polyprotein [Dictyocoela muelleri]
MEFFSVLDLKDGYFKVPLTSKDREKTAFLDLNHRIMQFTKMPQEYPNIPAIFENGMCMILDSLIGKACFVYMDDIFLFGKNKYECSKNLKLVENRLNEYYLIVNIEKSVYEKEQVEFLGYKIGKNKIFPITKRAEGIINYLKPQTKKQIMRFLGLMNYDRLFIPKISTLSNPLYKLLKMMEIS